MKILAGRLAIVLSLIIAALAVPPIVENRFSL
jgi:hypothetical protein